MPKGPCSMHSPVPAAPDASSQHSAPTSVSAAKPWAGAAESCGVACPSSSSAALDGSPSSAVDMFILGAEHPGVCSGVRVELSQGKEQCCDSPRAALNCPCQKGSLLGDPAVPLPMAQLLQRQGCGGAGTASWTQKWLVYFGEDQRRTRIIQPKERMRMVNSTGK